MSERAGGTDEHKLARQFRFFADMCRGTAPLYESLSRRITDDDHLMDMASIGSHRQPYVNRFFGAIHYLLLSGVRHRLRAYYPSLGGARSADDAFPALVDFCRLFESQLTELIGTRRVQTNEVGRSGLLLPAFARAAVSFDGAPLHLIEVGCSAGLNLILDRYQYEYLIDDSVRHHCGGASAVRIRTVLRERNDACLRTLSDEMPAIANRVGVDTEPIDIFDDDAVRWTEALIWADHVDRIDQLRAAVQIARRDPPPVIRGDGRELLPSLMETVPGDVLPCVFHSHTIYQWKEHDRGRFLEVLDEQGAARDLAHVSLEWLGDDPGPQLHLTTYREGRKHREHLADCHHHGRWLRWLTD